MREFTKSAMSLWIASSLFGLQQMQNILTPRRRGEQKGPATQAFDRVTGVVLDQVDHRVRPLFTVLDSGQRFAMGLAFNLFLPFISNYGSASSREAAWERGECEPQPASGIWVEVEDQAKAAMEQQDQSWREDIPFGTV